MSTASPQMRAWRLYEYGQPVDVLKLEHVLLLQPGQMISWTGAANSVQTLLLTIIATILGLLLKKRPRGKVSILYSIPSAKLITCHLRTIRCGLALPL